jgi:hypothetical protein
MPFLGTFANLTGYQLGDFCVETLVGRDAAGHPKWRIVCGKCRESQIVPHQKIALLIEAKAPENFQCVNQSCELSHTHGYSLSLADIKREERMESEHAARQEAAARQAATEQAAKDAKLIPIKAEYAFYARHQLGTAIEDSQILTFDRWRRLTPETRRMVLDALKTDRETYFIGL